MFWCSTLIYSTTPWACSITWGRTTASPSPRCSISSPSRAWSLRLLTACWSASPASCWRRLKEGTWCLGFKKWSYSSVQKFVHPEKERSTFFFTCCWGDRGCLSITIWDSSRLCVCVLLQTWQPAVWLHRELFEE